MKIANNFKKYFSQKSSKIEHMEHKGKLFLKTVNNFGSCKILYTKTDEMQKVSIYSTGNKFKIIIIIKMKSKWRNFGKASKLQIVVEHTTYTSILKHNR